MQTASYIVGLNDASVAYFAPVERQTALLTLLEIMGGGIRTLNTVGSLIGGDPILQIPSAYQSFKRLELSIQLQASVRLSINGGNLYYFPAKVNAYNYFSGTVDTIKLNGQPLLIPLQLNDNRVAVASNSSEIDLSNCPISVNGLPELTTTYGAVDPGAAHRIICTFIVKVNGAN